ncbi:MAG: hypothetical protein WCL71_13905, partial [Deltaproteobacteria bacterium]
MSFLRGFRVATLQRTKTRNEGIEMKYTKAKLQHGYANQILSIDVGTRSIAATALDPKIKDYFLG